jgi:hypothetical protein
VSPRFVSVPSAELLSAIKSWGAAVAAKGGRFGELAAGHEVAFVMAPPHPEVATNRGRELYSPVEVQIYTSVARGQAEARACGTDAVRIVVGTRNRAGEWRNVHPPQKVLRTAPRGEEAARVAAFIERLRLAVRTAYGRALAVPKCLGCGSRMAQRKSARGVFWGCVEYPHCRSTVEAQQLAPSRPILTRREAAAARELVEHLDDVAIKHHGCLPEELTRGPFDLDLEILNVR